MSAGKKVLMLASVASMIDQFNLPNIRLLLEMGYEVHVACNFKEGNTCDACRVRKLWTQLREMGVASHQWDCPRGIWPLTKCGRAYRQLWELTGVWRFDWMHCHSPVGGALARLAAYPRGIRVIYTAHGFHFYQGAPLKNWLLYYPAEKLLAYATDVLITVNQEDELFARKHIRAKKICRIPGVGVDVEKFAQLSSHKDKNKDPDKEKDRNKDKEKDKEKKKDMDLRRSFHIPKDALLLLSVGELNAGKNHKIVISALAALMRQDVYYLICGQGALRKELQYYASALGVAKRVCMPGYQENMPRVYQSADIFVFPSVREGMPVALMEAMAAGLPCVVSDIRGCRELIGKEFRFSPDHPDGLVKVLERLLDHAPLRQACGRRNQKKMEGYDSKAVREQMRTIYASMQEILL